MSPQARDLYNHIVKTVRNQPDIPLYQPIQAVLLSAKQGGLSTEDTKEVLDMLRFEFGVIRSAWDRLILDVIRKIPREPEGRIILS